MNIFLIAVLLLAIGIRQVEAAPSYLALCHKDWDCDSTLKTWNGKPNIVTGWLENTFNANCPCGDRILASTKPKVIRVHLINSPCMRNRRCGRYEVLYGYRKESASKAVHIEGSRLNRRFNAVLERFKRRLANVQGSFQCYVSPCLECDLDGRARRTLLNRVSAALPGCILVDNPHRHPCLKGFVCERHGLQVPEHQPCITDLDGTDGRAVSLQTWVANSKQCAIKYYWEPWMNCIQGGFVDPRQRDCRNPLRVFKKTRSILCQYFYPSFATCSR